MPIWSEILAELTQTSQGDKQPDFDRVRRQYLLELNRHTDRNVILYASGWLQKENATPAMTSISDEDMHALMEVSYGLQGPTLDLILHSPGGAAVAAEAVVSYLRSRFSHIRVIVPQLAMSAATMIACAADEILMGKHSFLGPTDPQLLLPTPLGMRVVPAQATLDQFDRAKKECADPANLSAWLPMLNQYGPDLLIQCETALNLSRELVETWLESYMLKNDEDRKKKARSISKWLANHQNFKNHARHLSRDDLKNHGLVIKPLETDHILQDLSLSVFHATIHTFSGTPTTKIVENHTGRSFIKLAVKMPITPGPQTPA